MGGCVILCALHAAARPSQRYFICQRFAGEIAFVGAVSAAPGPRPHEGKTIQQLETTGERKRTEEGAPLLKPFSCRFCGQSERRLPEVRLVLLLFVLSGACAHCRLSTGACCSQGSQLLGEGAPLRRNALLLQELLRL